MPRGQTDGATANRTLFGDRQTTMRAAHEGDCDGDKGEYFSHAARELARPWGLSTLTCSRRKLTGTPIT